MYLRVLMENTSCDPSLACEHGLSLYIVVNGKRILFDAGQTGAFIDNAARLGVDLDAVDLCILSHGHYDHSGGLSRFLEVNDHAPVCMHSRALEPHYNAAGKTIGVDPALAKSSRIILTGDEHAICSGLKLCTCNGMRAVYPDSATGMTVRTGAGVFPDRFEHEQYLVIEEHDRRIVVSGCSHKGVLNIASWLSPDVLVGGFHFMKFNPHGGDGAFLQEAAQTLLSLPCTYYTGHCTGEGAFSFLKERMGERLHALKTGYAYIL
ncbi:MAG: MBL fold metallo-hydrolase [Clostridia bacterium]|nr:MBL fold metallo-hydrolase [Clostridia bacterium]